jgi:hypothetical protein
MNETTKEFWQDWDNLVAVHGKNAHYLSNLVRYYIQLGGEHASRLVRMSDDQTEGVAALKIKRVFGVRKATQLLPPTIGADLVVNPLCQKDFVYELLSCVFGKISRNGEKIRALGFAPKRSPWSSLR